LNWLPWVGKNYYQTKILLIGDSYYDDNGGWLEYKNATREFVKIKGLDSSNRTYASSPFFRQIEKTILNKPSSTYLDREKIWSSIAFYNLVQYLLPSRNNRPTHKEFDEGWMTFLDLASVIILHFA